MNQMIAQWFHHTFVRPPREQQYALSLLSISRDGLVRRRGRSCWARY